MPLFRTTVFRLSLIYACVFSLLSAAGLGYTYWSTAAHSMAQVDARLSLETDVLLELYRTRAMPELTEAIRRRNRDDGQRKIFFYLLHGPQNAARTDDLHPWPEEARYAYATLRFGDVFSIPRSRGNADDKVRVLRTPLPGGHRLLVGRDLNDERTLLNHNLELVMTVIIVIFMLALVGSIILGRQTLRRIDAVNRTAQAIMTGDLSQRIATTRRNNEFDELGRTLNAMLERIEQLMTGMRQVTENIAHDLRSPLNRMRNRMEVTLLEQREPAEYQTVLEQNVADADALIQTFNSLLSIAQAEAGLQRDWAEQDLSTLVEDLAELYGVLAEEKDISFTSAIATDCRVQGNRQLLAQALSNLLENAVKYTPTGGQIDLTLERIDGRATVTVADSGPGIPIDQRDKVTERFVRLDSARSSPGNGLGLSLVKAVAKQHGAELILEDNQPGLRVVVRFQR